MPETIGTITTVSFDDLTSREKWKFYLGYLWRSIVAGIASYIVSVLIGGLIGAVIGASVAGSGGSVQQHLGSIQIAAGICGVLIGCGVMWSLVRWLFSANWFGYRLRLVKDAA
jgi:hypothetical protein